MRRSTFLIGSLMLVVSFTFHEFGLMSTLHQQNLFGELLAEVAEMIRWERSLGLLAALFQLFGGILAIFGLIVCFAGVAGPAVRLFKGS
ncbi:hypothetical protein MUP05_02265 [Candidatus Bathyarchaeota archaeon]|nr:hypothetical protein [Candidatus Bathyarchaeota archaeon]